MLALKAVAHEWAKTTRFWLKTARSSFFRQHLAEVLRFLYTRRLLSKHTLASRQDFLRHLGIEPQEALRGAERWWPLLKQVLAEKSHAGITKNDGMVLYGVARAIRPEFVIETGVADGVSTAFLTAALIDNGSGRLFSLELPPEQVRSRPLADDGSVYTWAERGVAHLVPPSMRERLAGRWEIVLGDVRETLPALLERLPGVDLFFHDDLHTPDHQLWEYGLVWPKVRPGGLLVSDDVNYPWLRFVETHGVPVDPRVNFRRMTAARKPLGSAVPSLARPT
jgi:predicted O-methyltransferase YrrM